MVSEASLSLGITSLLSSSARTQWEDGLFNRIYHKSGGYERVKYGVCNIVNDPNGVKALASLPSLDELRAKIVGLIQAPATKIAQVINAPAAKLARVVQAYANKAQA